MNLPHTTHYNWYFIGYILVAMCLPDRHHHGRQLTRKLFHRDSSLPPTVGIKIPVACTCYADDCPSGKYVLENIARAPSVIVRRNNNQAPPFPLRRYLRQGLRFLSGGGPFMRCAQNLVLRHASLDEIVFHQFRDSRIRPQFSAAGHDQRGQTLSVHLRRSGRAIGVKIIVAEHDDGVCAFELVLDNPALPRESEDGVAREIYNAANEDEDE